MTIRNTLLAGIFTCLCCAAAQPLARADIITLVGGVTITGKILEVTPARVVVLIEPANGVPGTMRIPRSRIKEIKYDFATRWEKLDPRDYEGQIKELTKAYREMAVVDNVQDKLEALLTNVAAPESIRIQGHQMLAEIYEKKEKWAEAQDQYRRLAALDRDNAAKWTKEAERLQSKVTVSPLTPAADAQGLEANEGWMIERWGNPGTVKTYLKNGIHKVLGIRLDGGPNPKNAVSLTVGRLPMNGKKAITMIIYNPSKQPIQMAMALDTSFGYHESQNVMLMPERWNMNVRFDLDKKTWKSQASGWVNNTEPKGLESVRKITFVIYPFNPRDSSGMIWIDRIKVADE